VTISAGVCDLVNGDDADGLFRLADGALYWSKVNGRDAAFVYDPSTIRELSAAERADHLGRSQTLLGIRALARAIDAKDPTTREHSERVARLACALAGARDWSAERIRQLEEAALVHDVGKIGVPDAVLLKPGRLDDDEYEAIKRHAALGAEMLEDVLCPEQVRWIRGHHERPDGRGYPDGLEAAQISEGAALLALADAFDVMTAARSYSTAKSPEVALAECRELVGRQFTAEAVERSSGSGSTGWPPWPPRPRASRRRRPRRAFLHERAQRLDDLGGRLALGEEEIDRARPADEALGLLRAQAAERHDRGGGDGGAHALQRVDVERRHPQVGDDGVGSELGGQALGLGPRGGLVDHVDTGILEPAADEHPVSDGVFADEHPRTWHP
jgi:hypothetical protein